MEMWLPFARARLAVVLLGPRLAGAMVERTRAETFVVEADDPAAALRAELDARGLAPRTVALGLARASVTVKPIELPPVGGALSDMVRFELERHLPFPADDAPFAFLPLPAAGEGEPGAAGATRVLIAATDRRVLDTALRLAQDARLRPVSVTVAAHDLLALVRAPRGQRVVWAHVTGDTADLLLVEGGRLVLSRSVPFADDRELSDEIARSLGPARWRGCDAVWVSGDLTAPATALGRLGAPVTAPPWTERARRWLDGAEPEPRGARTLALAVAAGRGLRPLDLIPAPLRPRHLTRPQMATAAMLAVTVGLALAALLVPGLRDGRRLAALDRELARIEPDVRAVRAVLGDLERQRRLLATVDQIETTALRPLPVLRDLTDILPADAWLTTLALDPKGVELVGQAAAASTLIPLLENSPRFERVEFASPVTRGRDREQFRIRAVWEAGPAAAAPLPRPGAAPRVAPPRGAAAGEENGRPAAPAARRTAPPRPGGAPGP